MSSGRHISDLAHASPLRHWAPTGKLLLTVALLVGSLLSPTPIVPLLVLTIAIGLVWMSCRWQLPRAMVLAEIYAILMMLLSVIIIGMGGPGPVAWAGNVGPLHLQLTVAGLQLAVLLFCRALAGFVVLLFYATSTPIPQVAWSLQTLGAPASMCELTVLIYRYSFLILEQIEQMFTAAECRLGTKGADGYRRTLSIILANVFGRSWDFAQRAQDALFSRNYQGSFPLLYPPKTAGWEWWAGSTGLLLALVALGQWIR